MREECQKFQNICAIFEELFDEQSEALPLKLFNYSNLSSYQTSWNFIIFWFIITPPLLELLSVSINNKKKRENFNYEKQKDENERKNSTACNF